MLGGKFAKCFTIQDINLLYPMEIIAIKNKGVMEHEALTIMGLSTKRDDEEKIGMFGTGNKYAISVFLREGFDVKVVTSDWHGDFATEKAVFRGKEYEKVVFNIHNVGKKELGITSEMGLLWDTDDAMREFICNARDEGGYDHKLFTSESECVSYAKRVTQNEKCTVVILKQERGTYISNYLSRYDERYLFNRKPVWESMKPERHFAIYEKPKKSGPTRIYKRGVLVCEHADAHASYDYEFNDIDIDESRSASFWEAQWQFGMSLFNLPNHVFNLIYDEMKVVSFEATASLFQIENTDKVPDKIASAIVATQELYEEYKDRLFGKKVTLVPERWYQYLKGQTCIQTLHRYFGDAGLVKGKQYKFSELDDIERQTIKAASAFCNKAGYKVSLKKLVVKDLSGPKGMYHDQKIYLDKTHVSQGIQDVVNTMIHEVVHRESRHADYTSGFQDALVREIVKQAMLRLKTAL